jgi:hypothetical protein
MRVTGGVIKPFIPSQDDTYHSDIRARCRKAKGFEQLQFARAKGREYLAAEHDYTLMRGDIDTGRKRTMLGSEAKALNESYEAKFIKDKTPRLWKWKWKWLRPEA